MWFRGLNIFAVWLCSWASVFAAQGPPPEVTAAFDGVIMVEGTDEFSGAYTVRTISTVQKPNGKARHDMEIVIDVDRPAEGKERRTLVSYVRDGEDVTEERRAKIEEANDQEERDPDDGEDGESEMEFVAPWGDDAGRYDFEPPHQVDSTIIQGFRPKLGKKDHEGLAVGRLVWNASTLDPISVELTVVHPPKPLKEFRIVMEFERRGDAVYNTRMVTDGLAKVLFMKREFHVDVHWTEIRPAGPS